MKGVRRVREIYCTSSGLPGGVAVEALEEVTGSEFYWMGLTMIFSGMMGSGFSSFSSGAWRRDRASAFIFLGPG